MKNSLETNIAFTDGQYYTCFQFEQRVLDAPNQIRLVLTDYDGTEQETECTLTLNEWEYLAKRVLNMVEYQRRLNNGTK